MNLDESKFPLLEKLTIIVPTYNRQEFALRYMHYWSETKVTIIIIDGSKKSLEPAVLKKLKKNIIYIHNPIGIYQRLLAAIKHINTEYVLLGCDDEFYIPSALNSTSKGALPFSIFDLILTAKSICSTAFLLFEFVEAVELLATATTSEKLFC